MFDILLAPGAKGLNIDFSEKWVRNLASHFFSLNLVESYLKQDIMLRAHNLEKLEDQV